MAMSRGQASFERFEPYALDGVLVTDRELGRGSYASVVELECRGLKCAGKKIYQAISSQGVSYALRRFAEECRLLSQMRHPNVVQFLGVHFERQVPIPMLVMEFLPTNLSSCIDQYGILPKEINFSILHDVSLGLNYLHSQKQPIIHRDLSANNVLLTSNMVAKISDLGVAKILNLTPLQVSRMTETPGTPTYMPPEVMVADPKYDTSVDVFSYGIMMIHVFSGKWPHPTVGQVCVGTNRQLIPVSEAERREKYLCDIGRDQPLMDLILRCIDNDPQHRVSASVILQRLKDMVFQFPPSFANKVEMLSRIEALEEEKRGLLAKIERKDREIEHKKNSTKVEQQTQTQPILQCKITWKRCRDLCTLANGGQTTIIDRKVYYGGLNKVDCTVYCYDPSQDTWSTLQPRESAQLSVRRFGLGQVGGQLVAVGGQRVRDDKASNEVYVFDEKSKEWKSLPSMPTARWLPSVVSHSSALIVVGGNTAIFEFTDAVEIFNTQRSRWYRADSLPRPCCSASPVVIGNMCYLIGGYEYPFRLNQLLCASIDQLLHNATTLNHASPIANISAWRELAATPNYNPTAAVIADTVLAIGGREETRVEGRVQSSVYMYSPSTNSWIYISDAPASRDAAATVSLSPTEILVIGGFDTCNQSRKTVFKGTLKVLV